MKTKLLFIHALSPLQAGTGQGVGVIDQPIAREKATNIPYLPGSSIKGVFRDASKSPKKSLIYGPAHDGIIDHQGSAVFSDARLLLLPVRSISGVFAWVTSPYLLNRFVQDAHGMTLAKPLPEKIPEAAAESCLVCQNSALLVDAQVILEDLPLSCEVSTELKAWADFFQNTLFEKDSYWYKTLIDRLCLVSDDVMGYLAEIGSQVAARIRLEEGKKKVAKGALWYEEALPPETILSALVVANGLKATPDEVYEDVRTITENPLQFGGSATVGLGVCRVILAP